MSLKDSGRVVGYSSLMPLEESVLLALLQDRIRERDIPLDAIKQWIDPLLSVYVSSITVKPTGNDIKDKERGWILIRHTVKWALSVNRQADIKNWYGIGATKKGQQLFEGLGFTEIFSLYNGERKGYYLEDAKKPVGLINKLFKDMKP